MASSDCFEEIKIRLRLPSFEAEHDDLELDAIRLTESSHWPWPEQQEVPLEPFDT